MRDTHPDLYAQLHPTMNGDLAEIATGSARKVWWFCPVAADHEWEATVNNRTNGLTGCPCCARKKVSVTNSLATLSPALAAQLHPDRNEGLTADRIINGSHQKVWWECPEGPDHVWRTKVNDRSINGNGCPCCAGYRLSVTNALGIQFPDVAAQFDRERNDGLDPNEIVSGSNTPRWWRCLQGPDHRWQAKVNERTYGKRGCPFCAGQKTSVTNSLAALSPVVAAQLHPDRNGGLTADQIVNGSQKKLWWQCPKADDHVWQAKVVGRTRTNHGCPSCSGRQASTTNSLAATFPAVAAQLDPDRNDGLAADRIAAGSERRFWWRCPKADDHVWRATAASRTRAGTGCPCCTGRQVSVTNSLATLSPQVAVQLDPDLNDGLTADQVINGSHDRLWWRCAKGPDHVWDAVVKNRTLAQTGCPACAGYQLSVTNSLATCFPALAAQLDPDLNDGLTADQIVFGSERQLWWRCPAGEDHIWQASAVYRTRSTSSCPYCSNSRPSVTNSLQTRFPEIAAQLHPDHNNGLLASQIVFGSNERVWWRCPTGPSHVWLATVVARTFLGSGCPTCANYGYSQALPGYVYLLAHDDSAERKIGISNVPAQRVGQHAKRGWRLLEMSPAFEGTVARSVEQRFLAVLTARGLRRRHSTAENRYDGYTEAWQHSDLTINSLTDIYTTIGYTPIPLPADRISKPATAPPAPGSTPGWSGTAVQQTLFELTGIAADPASVSPETCSPTATTEFTEYP